MEEKFNDILERDEKIVKVYKPNKKKFWWSANLIIFVTIIGIPFWIFIYPFVRLYYKNVFYCYTSKRIIVRRGIFGIDYKSLEYRNLTATAVYVSLLDKLVKQNTGRIEFGSPSSPLGMNINGQRNPYRFCDIERPYDVMREIKELIDVCENARSETTKKK